MEYILHVLVYWAFFSVLALSLDFAVGQLGILSLCHSAFFGVGAYTSALLVLRLDAPFWLSLPAAALIAVLLALPLALASRRLRHDALVVASLAILLITVELLKNLRGITGGLQGLAGIPDPVGGREAWICLLLLLLGISLWVWYTITQSSAGRSFRAFRDSPELAVSLGVVPGRTLWAGLSVSAGLAGVAGAFFASYIGYINPTVFGFDQSVLLLSMILIGGAATASGPLVGSAVLVLIPELLRFTPLTTPKVGAIQQALYGLALLIVCLWRPRGLMRGYRFH